MVGYVSRTVVAERMESWGRRASPHQMISAGLDNRVARRNKLRINPSARLSIKFSPSS